MNSYPTYATVTAPLLFSLFAFQFAIYITLIIFQYTFWLDTSICHFIKNIFKIEMILNLTITNEDVERQYHHVIFCIISIHTAVVDDVLEHFPLSQRLPAIMGAKKVYA